MDNRELSFKIAERLKQLRTDKGLSHDRLGRELYQRYKDRNNSIPVGKQRKRKTEDNKLISKDSLISYEVDKDDHTKSFSNLGMSVEFLVYLADYYGVSTDYILGRTDTKTTDKGIRAICSSSMLSESAAETLTAMQSTPLVIDFINRLLEKPDFLQKIASKYETYRVVKYAIAPVAEKYKKELADLAIYVDTILQDDKALPRVRVQDALDYARFELSRSALEFADLE